MRGKSILITSGPTSVPIDEMRVITNRSTGEMGRLLANACLKNGAKVTLLEGAVTTTLPLKGAKVRKFYLFDELDGLLKDELRREYDMVIHAAAVSDFKVKKPSKGKLSSGAGLKLDLIPTKKLVNSIRKALPQAILVGFKLETSIVRNFILKKTAGLFHKAGCDLVVANKQSEGQYRACLILSNGQISKEVTSKKALVDFLVGMF